MRAAKRSFGVVGVVGVGVAALTAHGDGYLWLGAEYQVEQHIYRYDIAAGVIDLDILHVGTDHWNNMACDGTYIYLGHPGSNILKVCDAATGDFVEDRSYSVSLSGHKEDGAYNPVTGNLWRVTYSGPLHETTTDGELLNSYSISGGLVGLAWVNDVLYTSSFNTGVFGRVDFDGADATFVAIPWIPGGDPPGSSSAALAYDEIDDVFYLVANSNELYCLSLFKEGVAATFIVDLDTVGYPGGGLIDGMSWFGVATCAADIAGGDGVVNVDDLLLVLASWGPCGDDCECPADIVTSGSVDVDDLLAVLAAWGPCPG